MQDNLSIKYFLITSQLSFIPDIILNKCEIVNIPLYTKTLYNKHINRKTIRTPNIKYGKNNITEFNDVHKKFSDKILDNIRNYKKNKYIDMREYIYDIFIFDINIHDVIWYILTSLIKEKKLDKEELPDVLIKTYTFLQLFNNNYRPIYHLENYFYYIIIKVHGLC